MGDELRLGAHRLVLHGPQLRRVRERRGVSQTALAKHLGVTQGTVSAWELGAKHPAMDGLVAAAAKFLGVSISSIAIEDEEDAS